MIDYEEDDNRTFVIDSAIRNNNGTSDEIRLYEQLSLVLELMNTDDKFSVVDSQINNGINFGIATRFPHPLPENVALMFFNINSEYNIKIKETSKLVYSGERYFHVNIRKDI